MFVKDGLSFMGFRLHSLRFLWVLSLDKKNQVFLYAGFDVSLLLEPSQAV